MTPPSASKGTILLVDDSLTNLAAFSESLADSGYHVVVANNGLEALVQLEEYKIDIILLDIIMPGIDGFETCRRLKAHPDYQHIPVIFMTTLSDTVDKVKGLSLGAVDYVTKPFQKEELLARIRGHVELNQLQSKLRIQNAWLVREIEERRKAEEELQRRNAELRQSEARFRDLVMSLSDWVWELDGQFCITYSSEKVTTLLGYEQDEVLGKTPFHFMTLKASNSFRVKLNQLLESKRPIEEIEHWVIHKEGHSVCLKSNGLPIFGDDPNQVIGYRGASKDITDVKQIEALSVEYDTILEMEVNERTRELEEKNGLLEQEIQERSQAEEALRASEERLAMAVHGGTYGMWDWNPASDELFLSARAKEMIGFEAEEIADTMSAWREHIHPDDLPQVKATVDAYLNRQTSFYENIYRMRHKNGSEMWVLERGVAVWDGENHPQRFTGIYLSLDERKKNLAALRESEQRYQFIHQATRDGVWDWDLVNDTMVYSTAWLAMLGLSAEEAGDRPATWQDRIHPEDQEQALATLREYLRQPNTDYHQTYRLRTQAGAYIKVLDRGLAEWDEQGNCRRFAGSLVNISAVCGENA